MKTTVVISQSQGKNPQKRQLEEEIAARLIMEPGIDVSLVPHLYDMQSDHTGLLFLRGVQGPLVVLGWLYPRGTRWTLDRQGVKGQEGVTLLVGDEEDEADEKEANPDAVGSREIPNRRLYCIDLRVSQRAEEYVEEVRRIAGENAKKTVDLMSFINGSPKPEQMQRYLDPVPIDGNAPTGRPSEAVLEEDATHQRTALEGRSAENGNGQLPVIDEPTKRRWYPVIDYSRCTNCLECLDFCLFGVYGVDTIDQILVEAQDNCKKGCPACSRVCPENAIIFPQHKTPAIAGADGEVAGLKIDLSKLFGGSGGDPLFTAVAERDAELLADGRDAVGMSVGIPKRQPEAASKPRDELDDLMDGLDALDL
jgi:NAD-dependent dihydropyrimidine dehydrogenase PreA subunit